jgi:hypothetical protein
MNVFDTMPWLFFRLNMTNSEPQFVTGFHGLKLVGGVCSSSHVSMP